MDSNKVSKEVMEAVEKEFADGSADCPRARALAERLGVPYSQVGQACNALKIKIRDCSLGCF
jgi:hypothetical protein